MDFGTFIAAVSMRDCCNRVGFVAIRNKDDKADAKDVHSSRDKRKNTEESECGSQMTARGTDDD